MSKLDSISEEDFLNDLDFENLNLESNLRNIVVNKDLKWIFVGGKGGVGKTTISSSLALLLTEFREKVLIISTDPAHNLSDIFMEKFSNKPQPLKSHPKLYAMEVDVGEIKRKIPMGAGTTKAGSLLSSLGIESFMDDIGNSIPGIDEVSVFLEIMREVQKMDFECIVFDTAPTGHTLRLLSFPSVLEKGYQKYFNFFSKIGSYFNVSENQINNTNDLIKKISTQFRNPELTTFVCVSIPSFLSLYETERLVQELTKNEIDTHNLVINCCILEMSNHCKLCRSRHKIQQKYIKQFESLYKDFHITKIPLFEEEISTVKSLSTLRTFLLGEENSDSKEIGGEDEFFKKK